MNYRTIVIEGTKYAVPESSLRRLFIDIIVINVDERLTEIRAPYIPDKVSVSKSVEQIVTMINHGEYEEYIATILHNGCSLRDILNILTNKL